MNKTALEDLAGVVHRNRIVFIASYDEKNNSTGLEIKAGDNQVIKVELVGSAALISEYDLGIGVGLSRD